MIYFVGCASQAPDAKLLKPVNFEPVILNASPFILKAFRRNHQSNQPIVIYIEGDGHAWQSSNIPSKNPTPQNPVALQLAQQDPRLNVAYLARPCQYVINVACQDNRWWTDNRFSETVIGSMNNAIDQLKTSPGQKLELIGFSGGAAIAANLAARRNDVIAFHTVAGNLNPHLVNETHNATAMPNTVDPMLAAAHIKNIPQIHYIGGSDDIVPANIAESFQHAAGQPNCILLQTIPDVSHSDGWAERWTDLLKTKPECRF